jgi:hypothetical protein
MSTKSETVSRTDLWVPAAIGIVGLSSLMALGYVEPYPSPWQTKLQVTILALSAAAFAAVIPGLLSVRMSFPGIAIRATSAIAVFLIVLYSDQLPIERPVNGMTAAAPTASISSPAIPNAK